MTAGKRHSLSSYCLDLLTMSTAIRLPRLLSVYVAKSFFNSR